MFLDPDGRPAPTRMTKFHLPAACGQEGRQGGVLALAGRAETASPPAAHQAAVQEGADTERGRGDTLNDRLAGRFPGPSSGPGPHG